MFEVRNEVCCFLEQIRLQIQFSPHCYKSIPVPVPYRCKKNFESKIIVIFKACVTFFFTISVGFEHNIRPDIRYPDLPDNR
jgi:hypothetical protein